MPSANGRATPIGRLVQRSVTAALLMATVSGFAGVGTASAQAPAKPAAQAPAQATAQVTAQAPAAQGATLAPGDGIRLRVYREPDLSGEFLVDERGIVVLPKVGEWNVRGIPVDSIRAAIRAALQQFIITTAIEVTPLRRVAVTGAVLKPGLYPVDPSMSVADAIILAGGSSPEAVPRTVEIRMAGAESGTPVSSEALVWNTVAGGTRQLYVPQKTWLQRNGVMLYTLILSTASTLFFIIRYAR